MPVSRNPSPFWSADRSTAGVPLPRVPINSSSQTQFTKRSNIGNWHPLREILDPPLLRSIYDKIVNEGCFTIAIICWLASTEMGPCIRGQHNCDENAICRDVGDNYVCQCKDNYYGDGTKGSCTRTSIKLYPRDCFSQKYTLR